MCVSSSLGEARPQPSYQPAHSRRPPEILILDPDPDSRRILGALLSASGYTAVEAATIDDVGGHVRVSALALVITESRDEDGRPSLPLAVREQPGMAQTPLIVHTSWLHLDDEIAAMEASAIAFIAKPCDHRMLLRCVARALRHDGLVSSETEWSEQAGLPLPWRLSVIPRFAS